MLVGVYGSLRKGMGNHRTMERAGGEYVTKANIGGLALHDYCGAYPCATIKDGSTLVVEVYEVDEEGMKTLDFLEGYRPGRQDNFYDRITLETAIGDVYVYIHKDSDRPVIEHGDWVKYKTGEAA